MKFNVHQSYPSLPTIFDAAAIVEQYFIKKSHSIFKTPCTTITENQRYLMSQQSENYVCQKRRRKKKENHCMHKSWVTVITQKKRICYSKVTKLFVSRKEKFHLIHKIFRAAIAEDPPQNSASQKLQNRICYTYKATVNGETRVKKHKIRHITIAEDQQNSESQPFQK